jgi:hypothetical protein
MLDKGEAMSLKEYSGFHIFWGDMHTNVHGNDIFFSPLTLDRLKDLYGLKSSLRI